MRMLVAVVKCDGCKTDLSADSRITGIEFQPSVGKRRTFEGELCEDCQCTMDSLFEKIAGLLPEVKPKAGRPPKDNYSTKTAHQVSGDDDFSDIPPEVYGTLSTSEELPFKYRECTLCGHVSRTRMDLSSHAKTVHGGSITLVARRLPTRKELSTLKAGTS